MTTNANRAAHHDRDRYFYNRGVAMGRSTWRIRRQARRLTRRGVDTLSAKNLTRLAAINSVLSDRGIQC